MRLQCYEGLDEAKALYEWDYAKQMLYTQLLREAVGAQTAGATSLADAADRVAGADAVFFSRRFLIERPLLRALSSEAPVVMLIDEIDRADPEFEAFLLEILAEAPGDHPRARHLPRPERAALHPHQQRVPRDERRAAPPLPARLRRLSAALAEQAILELRVPGSPRGSPSSSPRSFARCAPWTCASRPRSPSRSTGRGRSCSSGAGALDETLARSTLGVLLKYEEDRAKVAPALAKIGAGAR